MLDTREKPKIVVISGKIAKRVQTQFCSYSKPMTIQTKTGEIISCACAFYSGLRNIEKYPEK